MCFRALGYVRVGSSCYQGCLGKWHAANFILREAKILSSVFTKLYPYMGALGGYLIVVLTNWARVNDHKRSSSHGFCFLVWPIGYSSVKVASQDGQETFVERLIKFKFGPGVCMAIMASAVMLSRAFRYFAPFGRKI